MTHPRHHNDILRRLDEYATASGVEASTVCRKATGNPRLRDRLAARLRRTASDVEKLEKYMTENPPVSDGPGSLACGEDVTPKGTFCKSAGQ